MHLQFLVRPIHFFALGRYDKSAEFYKHLYAGNIALRMKEKAEVQLGLININAGDYATTERYYRDILKTSQDPEIQLGAHKSLLRAKSLFDKEPTFL